MQELVDWIRAIAQGDRFQAYIVALLVLVLTFIVAQLASRLMRRLLRSDGIPLPSSSILVNIVRICVWVVGVSVMLSACFNIDVNGLIAALGVGGIAVSLGLQDTIKNFFGGLQVTLLKIVKPGDHIAVAGIEGIVKDVSWRQTIVEDYERSIHLIPNAIMNSTEVTKVDPACLVSTVVVINNDGRDLDGLLRKMERLAKEAVQEVAPLEKDPWILLTDIREYGIGAKLRFVLRSAERAREARDAALRVIAPYTRSSSDQVLSCDADAQERA